MFKRIQLLLLLTYFILTACTSSKNEPSNTIIFDSESSARKSFVQSSIECEEPNLNCPGYISGLIIIDHNTFNNEWSTTACSSTLISKNKILSNQHCIPHDLLDNKISCNDRIKILFPKTNKFKEETVNCKSISASSPPNSNSNSPDWVVIELESSISRDTPDMNLNGLEENTLVHSFPIYYTKIKDVFKGKAQKNSCTTNMKHWHSKFYYHKESAVVTAVNCSQDIILGNSGAGYFNVSNELSFVGSFSVDNHGLSELPTYYWFGKPYTLSQKFVGGTNIGCIESLNTQLSPFCYHSPSNDYVNLLDPLRFSREEFDNQTLQETINKHQHIEWSENPTHSFVYSDIHTFLTNSSIQSSGFSEKAAELLPSEIVDYISKNVATTRTPFFPKCIKKGSPSSFILEIPFRKKDYLNFKVLDNGVIEHQLSLNTLSFEMKKTLLGSYKGFLQQAIEEKDQEAIITAFKSSQTQLYACRFINPTDEAVKLNGNPCATYNKLQTDQKQWLVDQKLEASLETNEIYLLHTNRSALEVTIPICD